MNVKGMIKGILLLVNWLWNALFIPFWHLQLVIPRSKNIWILGAWYGTKYADNCRSLFEYINKSQKHITPIWLSKNREDIIYIRSLGYRAYYTNSVAGAIYSLRAKIIIFSSHKKDVNRYFLNGAILINLWHAAPFKKVEKGITPTKEYLIKLKIYAVLLPWLNPYGIKHTIVLSQFFIEKMQNDFGVTPGDIFISGFPRNDNLFTKTTSEIIRDIKQDFNKTKIIMYMPTFRDYNRAYNYFERFDFEKFEEHLERTNSVFLFKGHYASETKCDFSKYKRILDFDSYKSNQELYILIKEVDVLITDYSSIFHDFLLLDRPILFTPFDLPKYLQSGRELHYTYDDAIPGVACKNWGEVHGELDLLSNNKSDYKKDIKYFKNKYHKFQDGDSSKRVFEEINNRYN